MTKKMHRTRRKMPKYIAPTIEGTCPVCKKHVKSVRHHMRAKHRGVMRMFESAIERTDKLPERYAGECPYCMVWVRSLEDHLHDAHGEGVGA